MLHNSIDKVEEIAENFNNIKKTIKTNSLDTRSNKFLESKLVTLSTNLKHADDEISNLESIISEEKDETERINKLYNANLKDLNSSKNLIDELNLKLKEKNEDIINLNLKLSAANNSKKEEYLNKLNEGNTKVIQSKNEKIKSLEYDLEQIYKNQESNLQKIQEYEEAYIKIENDKTHLSSNIFDLNNIINDLKTKLESLQQNYDIILNENSVLKSKCEISWRTDIEKPLLDSAICKASKKTLCCCLL